MIYVETKTSHIFVENGFNVLLKHNLCTSKNFKICGQT